ncbi:MAG TPA: MFS transporter [Candidatus Lustribacter sp.]
MKNPRTARNLIMYFVAFLTGDGAAQVQTVAVGWTVYGIHHRAFDLGLVGLVMFAPALLLVFVAGQVVDRYDRKLIVIAAALVEAVTSLVLAGLALAHVRDLGIMLAVIFALGVGRAFGSPAESTILVNLVEIGDYMRVQARYSSLREIVVVAGPALGGALVAVSDVAAFAVAAIMTFVSVAAFGLVHVRATERGLGAELGAGSALDGLRFIASRPIVLGAISLDLFAVLFGGASALLPIYADQILHVGAFGFGLLRSASGLGASVMAILLSQRTPNRRVGRTLLFNVAAFGLAMIVFAFSRNLWLSIVALAAAGAFDMVSVVIRRGLVQLNTPDAMRGRVNAVESVFIGASGQLGSFESGTVAQFLGPIASVALGSAATLGVVVLWARAFPALRRSDRLEGETGRS